MGLELDIAGQKNVPLLWWPPLIHIFLSSSLTSSLHDEVSVHQSKRFALEFMVLCIYDVRLGSCHVRPKCTNFITSQPSRIIFPSVGGAFGRRSLVGSQSVCQIFALLLGGFCNRAGGTVPAAHVVYVSLSAQSFKVPLSCSLPPLWVGQICSASAERGSLR